MTPTIVRLPIRRFCRGLLRCYDGVLAFGEAVRDVYIRKGWAERVLIWHEAADTRIFLPCRQERGGLGLDRQLG